MTVSKCHCLMRLLWSCKCWRAGSWLWRGTPTYRIFGFGQANLGVLLPRASTPLCTHICPQFNHVNGCGKAGVPWRSKFLAGCSSLTDLTPKTYWYTGIGDLLWMIIFVLFAMNMCMRIGCTCSLTATSAAEFGIIFPLTGPGDLTFSNVFSMQDPSSSIPSSSN